MSQRHPGPGPRAAASRPPTAAYACLLVASWGAPLCLAQTAEPSADLAQDALETVVVTATRREADVLEVPFSIAALPNEAIERRGLTNLVDIAQTVPGLFLVDQGPRADNLLVVRGIHSASLNSTEALDNRAGGSVSTYMGDIPLYLDLKTFDIQRIEVLLGPQGTLYGIDTLAGAIRYVPNRPDLQQASLDLANDTYGLEQSQGLGTRTTAVLNLPLVSQTLGLRIGAQYTNDPGFIDSDFLIRSPGVSDPEPDRSDAGAVAQNLVRKKDIDDEQTTSARVGLLWQPNEATQANLTYYYQDQRVGGRTVNTRQSFATDEYVSAARFPEPNRTENALLALEIEADLGFAKLTSATGYARFDQVGQRDQTDLLLLISEAIEAGDPTAVTYADFPAFASFTRETTEERTFSQELRLVSQSAGPLSWIGGVFYQRFDEDNLSLEFVPGFPEFIQVDRADDLEFFFQPSTEQRERAVFGELSYRLTDRWQATIGARAFDMTTDFTSATDFPLASGNPTGVAPMVVSGSTDNDGITTKLSTSYQFSPTAFGYFTVSEGYREGVFNPFPQCSASLGLQDFCLLPDEVGTDPDRTTNYELGLRTRMLADRLQLSAALYAIDWRDIQVQTVSTFLLPIIANGSEARSRGIELAASARLGERWLLEAQYTFTDAELTRNAPGIVGENDSDPASPTYDGARDGDRLPGSPRHAGGLTASYLQPLPGGWDLRADYGVRATSDILTRAGGRGPGESLSGYALHRAALILTKDRWTARLHVENVFDRFVETSIRSSQAQIRSVGANDFAVRAYSKGVLRPRVIGLDVGYKFDW